MRTTSWGGGAGRLFGSVYLFSMTEQLHFATYAGYIVTIRMMLPTPGAGALIWVQAHSCALTFPETGSFCLVFFFLHF